MTSEDCIKTCCVRKCASTSLNSDVNFFKFPETRHRSIQRNKWIQAVRSKNGQGWHPNRHSFICSEHFVKGQPNDCLLSVDYTPSVFMRKEEIKSRAVSVKQFALQYIKHDALLERPSRANVHSEQRKSAYMQLATDLDIPERTVRVWERRFREYVEQKMAALPDKTGAAGSKPPWFVPVAKRLRAGHVQRPSGGGGRGMSPSGVVAALCEAARARGVLCSTALYTDVRRVLRMAAAISDLHAIWVSAQRVSLEQVRVLGRAGDPAPPPAHTAAVADLVLLHSDVDIHRLVTDESVTLYEELAALDTLWQLVQRHQLEGAAPTERRARMRRWTCARRDYLVSGRSASLVVLQRRWHELKLQARERLAAHWRCELPTPPGAPAPGPSAPGAPAPGAPAPGPPAPGASAPGPPAPGASAPGLPAPGASAPGLFAPGASAPGLFAPGASAPGNPADPAPGAPAAPAPCPRPAPIHIAILKRWPHVATGAFHSWRELVLDGSVVTEPLEEDGNVEETQGEGKEQSPETTDPLQLDPKVKQSPDVDPLAEKPPVDKPKIEKIASSDLSVEHSSVDDPLAERITNNDVSAEPAVDKSYIEKTTCEPLDKQNTTGDSLAVQPSADEPMDTDTLDEDDVTNNELNVEQNTADNPVAEKPTVIDLLAVKPSLDKTKDTETLYEDGVTNNELNVKQNTVDNPVAEQPIVKDLLAVKPSLDKSKDTDTLDEQSATVSDSIAVTPTVNKIKVELTEVSDSCADNPGSEQFTTNIPMDTDTLDEDGVTNNELNVKQNTADNPVAEQPIVKDLLAVKPSLEKHKNTDTLDEDGVTNNELSVKQNTADNPVAEQPTVKDLLAVKHSLDKPKDTDTLDKQSATVSDSIAVTSTVNNVKVELTEVSDSCADNPGSEQFTTNIPIDTDTLEGQGTKEDRLLVRPTLKEPKVEQATDSKTLADNPGTEQTTNLSIVNEPEVVRPTENNVVEQSNVVDPLVNKSGGSQLLTLLTSNSLAKRPTVKETVTRRWYSLFGGKNKLADSELLNKPSTRGSPARSAGRRAPRAATGVWGAPTGALDRSSGVMPPYHQVKPSDTDTDSDDNLVIDEFTNNAPCSLEPGPIARTERHIFDTVSTHTALGNIDPTIAVLQMIDPSTVQTEIVFESDEEDFTLHYEEDKVEIDTKEEVSLIANKLVFVDEEAVSCDVNTVDNVTELMRMDCEDSRETDDIVNETSTIDPKLLMETKIRLFRFDETRAWKNNVRKDKSIKFSRIHRRFYTPNPKKYYITPVSNNKTKTRKKESDKNKTQEKKVGEKSRSKPIDNDSQPTRRNNSNSDDKTKTQEIIVDNACLDRAARTHSIKQFCFNIKRELMEEQLQGLEDETPLKRVKTEVVTEDKPSLSARKKRIRKDIEDTDTAEDSVKKRSKELILEDIEDTETAEHWVQKEMVEELSSDDELLDDVLLNDEVFIDRSWEDKGKGKGLNRAASTMEWSSQSSAVSGRAKRVRLPDRARPPALPPGRVLRVAPISCAATTMKSDGKDSGLAETAGDAADVDTPLAPRALDLPADEQLEAALDELTWARSPERAACCAARRGDSRELPVHAHRAVACSCGTELARAQLDVQLRSLHDDIERMLRKTASGRSHSKPAQKRAASPTSTNTLTLPATDTPSTETTEAKPIPSETKSSKARPTYYTYKSRKRRSKPASATPAVAPEAPIVDYYEEWQRQKTLNAQYFHIQGSKKDKRTPSQSVVQSTTSQSSVQSTAPQIVGKSTTPQTAVQSTSRQSVVTHSTAAESNTPLQNTQSGLMPYIRESRLIAPAETTPLTHCIKVPSLIPVQYPRGIPARLVAETPPARATPPGRGSPVSQPQSWSAPRNIAPKPGSIIRRASEAQNTVIVDFQTTTQPTNRFICQTSQPGRMNLTIQQVAEQVIPARLIGKKPCKRKPPVSQPQSWSSPRNIAPKPESTTQKTTEQSTSRQSVATHSKAAESITPPPNTQSGLMPYIRESRLIAPAATKSGKHCIEVPTLIPVKYLPRISKRLVAEKPPKPATPVSQPQKRSSSQNIAPKPKSIRCASEAQNTVKVDFQTTTQPANPFSCQTSQPSRVNLTTQQVVEQPSPADKPVSILEEYARTLSIEPVNNVPVVNAVSLRVPNGPQGPKTTILMALTLPSDDVIKKSINGLYANDTIDLTNEPETCEVQKTTPPVCDIVGVVKSLVNAGNKSDRSLLKPQNNTADKSPLPEKPNEATKQSHEAPKIMSFSNTLHDGDIIEIDDTDSDSDTHDSNDNHASESNSSTHTDERATLYCNETLDPPDLSPKSSNPDVYINKRSKLAKSETSNKKTSNQSTSITDPNQATNSNSIQTKSNNTKSPVQTTSATNNNLNQDITSNINKSVNQTKSSNTVDITQMTSPRPDEEPDVGSYTPMSTNVIKITNIGNSNQGVYKITEPTCQATLKPKTPKINELATNKNTESVSNPMTPNQSVSYTKSLS